MMKQLHERKLFEQLAISLQASSNNIFLLQLLVDIYKYNTTEQTHCTPLVGRLFLSLILDEYKARWCFIL